MLSSPELFSLVFFVVSSCKLFTLMFFVFIADLFPLVFHHVNCSSVAASRRTVGEPPL